MDWLTVTSSLFGIIGTVFGVWGGLAPWLRARQEKLRERHNLEGTIKQLAPHNGRHVCDFRVTVKNRNPYPLRLGRVMIFMRNPVRLDSSQVGGINPPAGFVEGSAIEPGETLVLKFCAAERGHFPSWRPIEAYAVAELPQGPTVEISDRIAVHEGKTSALRTK